MKHQEYKIMEITKRNGEKVEFNKSKIINSVKRACKSLERVDVDIIVHNASIKLFNGVSTKDIDESLIKSARALYEQHVNYGVVASRLLSYTIYKDVINTCNEHQDIDDKDIDYHKRGVSKEKIIPRIFKHTIKTLQDHDVLNSRLNNEYFDFDVISKSIDMSRDDKIPYAGAQTLSDRYIHKINGRPAETIQTMWMRIAMGLALGEGDIDATSTKLRNTRTQWAIKIYNVISNKLYMPSTPTLFNSGSVRNQLSSCFLSTFEDSLEGIFDGLHQQAQMSKYAGGLGFDITPFRASGQDIKSMNGKTQGSVYFWKLFNDMLVAVNQGGKRKGAGCAYIEPWHGEIKEFLQLKKNTGDERRRTHDMNTAVWIPDLFMEKVLKDEPWYLFSPDEVPELHETFGHEFRNHYNYYVAEGKKGNLNCFVEVNAKQLWKEQLKMLFETGGNWITFKDPCNIRYANQHEGVVHSSNLCTEITLHTKPTRYSKNNKRQIVEYGETAVCNLGSIVLSEHLKVDEDGKKVIDYEKLSETIHIGARMLDNVIDINFYPTEEASLSNRKHRPVGMGSMGWHDTMLELGINYDSDESIKFSADMYEYISRETILANTKLAEERGTYETYAGSLWDQGILPIDSHCTLMNEHRLNVVIDGDDVSYDDDPAAGHPGYNSSDFETLDWSEVRSRISKFGMRNGLTMAIAPNATIARIVGTSPCTEPYYSLIFSEGSLSGDFIVINKHFMKDCEDAGIWNETMVSLLKSVDGDIEELSAKIPDNDIIRDLIPKYKNAFSVGPTRMIDQAAVKGMWLDQAASLNIFSATTSLKVLNNIYMRAYAKGLKTTYYLRGKGASGIEKSSNGVSQEHIDSLNVSSDTLRNACSIANPESCIMCD